MSPTSYQAAPPRVSARNLGGARVKFKSARWVKLSPTAGCAIPTRVPRRGKAIEQLLRAAHHPEILARDPLLQLRVMLQSVAVATQGIDDARQRVDRRDHLLALAALVHEIERAVLATLHRED